MEMQTLQNEITNCIWSTGLKKRIAEVSYSFSEKDLLGIAFHFSQSFEERIRLLQLLADSKLSVSEHAARCVSWQKESLAAFKQKGGHEVYELRIKVEPDYIREERYLCDTYDTALQMIDAFYDNFEIAETGQTRYIIEKRTVFRSDHLVDDEDLRECVLRSGKVLFTVDSSLTEYGPCCYSCLDCANPCILNIEVCFPTFISDRSPVRYRTAYGDIRYGIHLNFGYEDKTKYYYYVIPLNGDLLKLQKFDRDWGRHEHDPVSAPNVDIAAPEELDAELLENYQAFLAWMDSEPEMLMSEYRRHEKYMAPSEEEAGICE